MAVICRDGPRMAMLHRALSFFAPDTEVLEFPAWDCLPYDRVSPHAGMVAQRMSDAGAARPRQRPRAAVRAAHHRQRHPAARSGARDGGAAIARPPRPATCCPWTASFNGSNSTASIAPRTVREAGDYAVRGGILDLFAPGMDSPVRLDFFGDTLESIRSFDPETQRTSDRAARARSRPDRRVSAHQRHDPAVPHRLCRGLRRRRSRRRALRGGERRPPLRRHGALAAAVPQTDGHAVRLSRKHARRARAAGRGSRA